MSLHFLSATTPAPNTGGELGGAWLGELAPAQRSAWPMQGILAPLFGSTAAVVHETWLAQPPLVAGENEGIVWRRTEAALYGVIELDEAQFAASSAESALQKASNEAYQRIFRLLDAQQVPHLWRVWNYLPGINQESDGLERYRQFNIGRQEAFIAAQRGATGNVPAACALGLAGGPLSIAFLAGTTPAVPVENPRQISAYHYPADYGPRSPTFSRAALVYPPGQEILFVSGTASIVGHQTVHAEDVAGQCRETLANIAAVLAEANRQAKSPAFSLDTLTYRVYVRHAADFPLIRDIVQATLGEAAVLYLQADVCRHDLLLEIEAQGIHPWEG